MTLIVTGGAGFIGGNFVLDWLKTSIQADPRHTFVQGDTSDRALAPLGQRIALGFDSTSSCADFNGCHL